MNRNDDTKRTQLEDATRDLLREGADGLDGRVRSRLTQARHAALAEMERPQGFRALLAGRGPWLPVAAAAGVGALALAVTLRPGSPVGGPAEAPVAGVEIAATVEATPLEDMDLLAANGEGFYEEDLEFYAWAAEEAAAGTVAPGA